MESKLLTDFHQSRHNDISNTVEAFIERCFMTLFLVLITMLNRFLFTEANFLFDDCLKILVLSNLHLFPFILTLKV